MLQKVIIKKKSIDYITVITIYIDIHIILYKINEICTMHIHQEIMNQEK